MVTARSARKQFATLAARHAIPTAYATREFPEVGGLMSYGTDIADRFRQVGVMSEQSTKFEFVITNSNTSYQIQARVIEADSPSAVVYGGADMPLTGPIPEGGTFFCFHCGALSLTYSRLSKSDSNIDLPLALPVRAASITSAR